MGKRDYVFLIDETHNLLDRGREMYSAALFKESFLHIKRLVKDASPRIVKLLDKCNKELLSMKRQCERYRKEEGIDGFVMALNRLYAAMDDFLDEHDTFPDKKEIMEFYFEVAHFLNMYEIMDEHYVVYSQLMEDGGFMLKLFCVNPALNLRQCMKKGGALFCFPRRSFPSSIIRSFWAGNRPIMRSMQSPHSMRIKGAFDCKRCHEQICEKK